MDTIFIVGQTIPIAKVIKDLYSKLQRKDIDALKELDIKRDIEFVESLLIEVEADAKNMEKHSIKMCIRQIHEIIIQIQQELESIELLVIKEHYAKYRLYSYLTWWYKYTNALNTHIKNIETLKRSLKERTHLLIRLIKN